MGSKSALGSIVCALLFAVACGHRDDPVAHVAEEGNAAPVATQAAAPAPAAQSPDGPASIAAPEFAVSTAAADVDKGKALFMAKGCSACHKIGGGKLVGPDLKGVTARRHQKWIERMILKPEVMLQEDDVAKGLFRTHLTAMSNQSVNPDTELPAIVSYLKANE